LQSEAGNTLAHFKLPGKAGNTLFALWL